MSGDDDSNELQEGKNHLQEGAQKIWKGSLKKGREKRENLGYYSRNRQEILNRFGIRGQKKPAIEGLIVLIPILVVGLVVAWLFSIIEDLPYSELFNITGLYIVDQSFKLGVILASSAILATFTGKLMKLNTGYKIEKTIDKVFGAIPFLGGIYRITKITTETVIEGAEELRKPVKIEFGKMKITGFKTGNKTKEGRHLIFIPTSPNITTGLLLEIKPEHITETQETPEQALTRILSAGSGQNNKEG